MPAGWSGGRIRVSPARRTDMGRGRHSTETETGYPPPSIQPGSAPETLADSTQASIGAGVSGATTAPKETKRQKFRRLAAGRLAKTIKCLHQLYTLADRRNYDYSDEQRDYVVAALKRDVTLVLDRFAGADSPAKQTIGI